MIELFPIICSAIGTALISYFSGWFSAWNNIWRIILVFIGLWFAVMVVIFGTAYIIHLTIDVKKPVKKPSKFHTFVYHCFLSFLDRFFRVKLHVSGEEKLPDGPCVFVMNHRSNFDPMLLADKYKKRKILMISKPENFKKPIAGGFIHKAGYMAINRDDDREALKTVLQAIKYLKSGYSIGIYPEGTRNKDSLDLLPFKHGSFKIGTKAGVPIVITCIHETQNISKNFPLKRTHVYLHILETIKPEDYAGKNTAEISDYAAKIMQEDIDKFESQKALK